METRIKTKEIETVKIKDVKDTNLFVFPGSSTVYYKCHYDCPVFSHYIDMTTGKGNSTNPLRRVILVTRDQLLPDKWQIGEQKLNLVELHTLPEGATFRVPHFNCPSHIRHKGVRVMTTGSTSYYVWGLTSPRHQTTLEAKTPVVKLEISTIEDGVSIFIEV